MTIDVWDKVRMIQRAGYHRTDLDEEPQTGWSVMAEALLELKERVEQLEEREAKREGVL